MSNNYDPSRRRYVDIGSLIQKISDTPVGGNSVERWQTLSGLTSLDASANLGVQVPRLNKLKAHQKLGAPLKDQTLEQLILLYTVAPDIAPLRHFRSVQSFYAWLNLDPESESDMRLFASMIGRSYITVKRILASTSLPGVVMQRWFHAIVALGLTPNETRAVMLALAGRFQK